MPPDRSLESYTLRVTGLATRPEVGSVARFVFQALNYTFIITAVREISTDTYDLDLLPDPYNFPLPPHSDGRWAGAMEESDNPDDDTDGGWVEVN